MPLGSARHQKPAQAGRHGQGDGETGAEAWRDEARTARDGGEGLGRGGLQVRALASANMVAAWKRVKANRGSAGVDGLTIAETAAHLRTHWPRIRQALLDGSYRPQPVRRVQIPKPTGGVRELGIPTVTDRLIQQALLQVLQPIIDPTFSEHSYGFRPGRRAHDAVLSAQRHVQDGYRVVVDVDLEKFLDRASYCPQVHDCGLKKSGWFTTALIRSPFCRPRRMMTASSSPRFTRCNTVWRETPRRWVATCIAT